MGLSYDPACGGSPAPIINDCTRSLRMRMLSRPRPPQPCACQRLPAIEDLHRTLVVPRLGRKTPMRAAKCSSAGRAHAIPTPCPNAAVRRMRIIAVRTTPKQNRCDCACPPRILEAHLAPEGVDVRFPAPAGDGEVRLGWLLVCPTIADWDGCWCVQQSRPRASQAAAESSCSQSNHKD